MLAFLADIVRTVLLLTGIGAGALGAIAGAVLIATDDGDAGRVATKAGAVAAGIGIALFIACAAALLRVPA